MYGLRGGFLVRLPAIALRRGCAGAPSSHRRHAEIVFQGRPLR